MKKTEEFTTTSLNERGNLLVSVTYEKATFINEMSLQDYEKVKYDITILNDPKFILKICDPKKSLKQLTKEATQPPTLKVVKNKNNVKKI